MRATMHFLFDISKRTSLIIKTGYFSILLHFCIGCTNNLTFGYFVLSLKCTFSCVLVLHVFTEKNYRNVYFLFSWTIDIQMIYMRDKMHIKRVRIFSSIYLATKFYKQECKDLFKIKNSIFRKIYPVSMLKEHFEVYDSMQEYQRLAGTLRIK